MMSAIGALVAADAGRLARTASVAAAISCEALLGTDVAYAAAYQLARPHPGQIAVAQELRWLLRDSTLMTSHHPSVHKVQDPYSLRCVPQVHGAVRDALGYLDGVLDIELNSATDNPLVFPVGGVADATAAATGGGMVISGGNFHGEPVAFALDFAKLAISELGAISERRIALMVDARLNGGLPPFLSSGSGLESGIRFVAALGESGDRLRSMLASLVSKELEERRSATLRGIGHGIDGDRTVRGADAGYLSYQFENGVWHRRRIFIPEQPSSGFTVARNEDSQEIQRLCHVYQASDEEGRRLIRMFAELSVSDALNIPPSA
jgi:hypothetical protein